MQTFSCIDSKKNPTHYTFTCLDGKIVLLAWKEYLNDDLPECRYRKPGNGQLEITTELFERVFRFMCEDTSFSNFKGFFDAIRNDDVFLPLAKTILAKNISWNAKRLSDMSEALE
ncbi:MAG: hypothetical protein IKL08_01860 [Clostridia bacterium]|nr:hypothetical protein [Clostridia bacterium]